MDQFPDFAPLVSEGIPIGSTVVVDVYSFIPGNEEPSDVAARGTNDDKEEDDDYGGTRPPGGRP